MYNCGEGVYVIFDGLIIVIFFFFELVIEFSGCVIIVCFIFNYYEFVRFLICCLMMGCGKYLIGIDNICFFVVLYENFYFLYVCFIDIFML